MDAIVEAFSRMDFENQSRAFENWISKKNRTIETLKEHTRPNQTLIQRDRYEEWLQLKKEQEERERKEKLLLEERLREKAKLEQQLKEIKQKREEETFLIWLESKKMQKAKEVLASKKHANTERAKLAHRVERIGYQPKQIKVIRAKHSKEWVSILANPEDGQETMEEPKKPKSIRKKVAPKPILSPPLLFQEQERIKDDSFKKKYRFHVANGY
jgi:hypothetical protein